MAKLRKYAKDYNINVSGVVEKDDLIDRIIAARVWLLRHISLVHLLIVHRHQTDVYPLLMR